MRTRAALVAGVAVTGMLFGGGVAAADTNVSTTAAETGASQDVGANGAALDGLIGGLMDGVEGLFDGLGEI